MAEGSDQSSQVSSRSFVSPFVNAAISDRMLSRVTRSVPSRETSWSTREPGTRPSGRPVPDGVVIQSARLPPTTAAVKKISPFDDHARPSAVANGSVRTFFFPSRSTTATEPPSSPGVGWSMNATSFPSGATRRWLTQPLVS